MFVCHICDGMLVTAKAGISRGGAWMTCHAGNNWIITVSKREGMREGGRLPGCGGMTGSAGCSSFTCVRILGGMAGKTICRRARKDIVDMALGTDCVGMRAGQREGGFAVIERSWLPT
jgi:hypothetical protein